MKSLFFISLIISCVSLSATQDQDGVPTQLQIETDIKTKIYAPCKRNKLIRLAFGPNMECVNQSVAQYMEEHHNIFQRICAQQLGQEHLNDQMPDKPVIEYRDFESFKQAIMEEEPAQRYIRPVQTGIHIPLYTTQTHESNEVFWECVAIRNRHLGDKVTDIIQRDIKYNNVDV